MVLAIGIALMSSSVIIAWLYFLKRQITVSVGSEKNQLAAQAPVLVDELRSALEDAKGAVSRSQLEFIQNQVKQAEDELAQEKSNLAEIESKLDEAQRLVETKESEHQELKSSKEEDELRLKELMASYSSVSEESMSLEQKLASSMKNLDALLGELELTADQRAVLEDLSNALSNAGSQMRDLLTEYSAVHERLEMLQQQHQDLETEYTRLVEQQLGE